MGVIISGRRRQMGVTTPGRRLRAGARRGYRAAMSPLLFLLLILQSANAPPAPAQACFEILADSDGEMTQTQDLDWRRKAVGDLKKMRAEHDRYRASINRKLAQNAKARDRLQQDFHRREIEEDDFNAARSEIETETRRLLAERDNPQLPACGF